MEPTPAQEASNALIRVAALSPDDRPGTSRKRGGASRVQILTLLQASEVDLSAEELSENSGLHVNTIRGHIDVLLAGGHVESVQAQPHGRGRPKLKYRAVPNPDSPYEDLSRALSATLTDALATAYCVDPTLTFAKTKTKTLVILAHPDGTLQCIRS